jgi:hypothetical protein
MKMAVFWADAPCSLIEVYLITLMMEGTNTSETSSRLHGATTQKTAVFILADART